MDSIQTAARPARDYEVGYGRPPKATRFQPGRSGNPKGRRKGSKNFQTELREGLGEMVTIAEGGKPRRMTRFMAAVVSLSNRVIKGEAKMAEALERLVRISAALMDPDEHRAEALSPEELAQVEKILSEIGSA